MKQYAYTIAAAALMLATAACQRDEAVNSALESDPNAVKLNATIATATRVNTTENGNTWTSGDQIKVINTSANAVSGKDAAIYSYTSSWERSGSNYLVWVNGDNSFEAFYPYNPETLTSFTQFNLPQDQSTVAKITTADWMTASKTTAKTADKTLSLEFKHLLSKVTIRITGYNSEFSNPSHTPIEAPTFYNPSLLTKIEGKTVSATASIQALMTPSTTDGLHSFTAVLAPGKYSNGNSFFSLSIYGETLLVKPTTALTTTGLESGKAYLFTLIVGKNRVSIGSVSVNDWGDSDWTDLDPSGTADELPAWDGTKATAYAAGDGTEKNPYLIETASQFSFMTEMSTAQQSAYYKLTADLNLGQQPWEPIRNFKGNFDGGDHTIYGLRVVSPSPNDVYNCGLFANLIGPGKIHDLFIRGAKVSALETLTDAPYATGILVGGMINQGDDEPLIEFCQVSGTISATDNCKYIGGIVGNSSNGKIRDCTAEVTITGNPALAGGLAGFLYAVQVSNCNSKGSIAGAWSVGGLVGAAEGIGQIARCTAEVDITTNNWNVGGFIGWSSVAISNCVSQGTITSTANWASHTYKTGGFAGTNAGQISSSRCITKLTYADDAEFYGAFLGNDNGGTTTACRFDGTQNPELRADGTSSVNEVAGTNDIKNSLN